MTLGEIYFSLIAWFLMPFVLRLLSLHEDQDFEYDLASGRLWRRLTSWTRVLPPLALALVVVYWLKRASNSAENNAQELFLSIFFGVLLIVLTLVFAYVLRRRKANAPIAILFAIGFLLPWGVEVRASRNAASRREAAMQELIASQLKAEAKWSADLRQAGAHGEPGVVPPMIEVMDDGDVVTVTNRAGRPICLRIARVSGASLNGVFPHCDFSEFKRTLGCIDVGASRSSAFNMPRAGACADLPLEFRIGEVSKPDVAWWSDTALQDFETRLSEFRRSSAGSSGVGYHLGFYSEWTEQRIRDEAARLALLASEGARADRWRSDIDFWKRLRPGE